MPSETHPNAVWSADAKVPVKVTVDGTGPFTLRTDGAGVIMVYQANGTPAKVTMATDAVIGYQAAVTETANVTFYGKTGREIAAEILAEANAA